MCTDPKQKWRPDFARLRGLPYLAIAAQIEEAFTLGSSLPATDCRRSARSPTIQVFTGTPSMPRSAKLLDEA
jgi:hypothetical protein